MPSPSGICAGNTSLVQSRKVKNVTHHINRKKYKNPVIISIGAEKVFDNVYYSFIIKIINKRELLNLIRGYL